MVDMLTPDSARAVPSFLDGGGEMGRLIRSFDWASTDLGPPAAWPPALRVAVQMMINTRHPSYVFWGSGLRGLYNDAYSRSLGADKHPALLGLPGRQVWGEIWPIIGPQIEQVMSGGEATWHEDQLVPILRNGVLEEAYWTYSYSPLSDDAAPFGVGGVLVLCNETTAQVRARQGLRAAEERWRSLFDQAPGFVCILRGPEHRFEFVNPRYQQLLGGRPLIGLTVAQAVPEADGQGYFELLDSVYSSGQPFTATGRALTLRGPDSEERQVHLDFVYQPIVEDGRVNGIFVQGNDVTDRVRATTALADSEARWRALAENLPGGAVFVVDTDLRYQLAAGEALAAAGLHADQLVGLTVPEVIPPDSAKDYVANYRQALEGRRFEVQHRDHDRHYLTRGVPLRDDKGDVYGVLAASYDVSAQHVAKERLQTALAQLDGVMGAAEIGTWNWHLADGVIQHDANLAKMYDMPGPTSTPEQHFERIHPEDHAVVQNGIDAALESGQLYIREFRIVTASGQRWVAGRGRLQRDADGRPERLTGLVFDISDLKRLEETLVASDRHKDRFLAVLAHELRNPLAPLLNAASVLDSETLSREQLRWCGDVINRQVQHMALLLEDLLDIAGIKYGRVRMAMEPVLLQRLVDSAVEAALPKLRAREQSLQIELPQPPLRLQADPGRMAQVLSNLLTNASKYTAPGGQVRLVARRLCTSEAEIAVHDTGIGLEPADCERIFDMFSQVDSTAAPSAGGLGIGLALVKGFVELHGGHVRAESPGRGQGSVFTMVLPVLAAELDSVAPPEPPISAEVQPRRVLIADDNTDAAESLAMLLNMAGHTTRVVADGVAALSACAEFKPEVALLDIGMPGLDGYEVARRLRADPAHASVVLAALTGWGLDENRRLASEVGFDSFFTKPVEPVALLALLATARAEATANAAATRAIRAPG